MSIIKGKLRIMSERQVAFHCPGCDGLHVLTIDPTARPCWSYNGLPDAPTFSPSVLVRTGHYIDGHKAGQDCWCSMAAKAPDDPPPFTCTICHSFVTDGRIRFLPDSTHALAGQTVDLPEIEEAT